MEGGFINRYAPIGALIGLRGVWNNSQGIRRPALSRSLIVVHDLGSEENKHAGHRTLADAHKGPLIGVLSIRKTIVIDLNDVGRPQREDNSGHIGNEHRGWRTW